MDHEDIDDQTLESFVDDQLDPAGRQRVIRAMEENPIIREHIAQLRYSKDLMKLAFGDATAPTRTKKPGHDNPWKPVQFGLAASLLLLAVSLGSGVLGYYVNERSHTIGASTLARIQQDRVILHISESEPKQFASALAYVELFMQKHEQRGGKVEVVANSGGLDLLRENISPYEKQVIDMISKHDNVQFIACANAIRNLRKEGIEPVFVPNIETGKTAIDHVINRLQAGWTYVNANSLVDL